MEAAKKPENGFGGWCRWIAVKAIGDADARRAFVAHKQPEPVFNLEDWK